MLITPATTQTTLSIVKDEFAKVITEGTLSPTNKPSDWNIVITKKSLTRCYENAFSPLLKKFDVDWPHYTMKCSYC
jgi:hypothetical protein